jgi:vacuolar-type H+-ATPase subunit F/Vma7
VDGAPAVLTNRAAAAGWRLGGAHVRVVEGRDAAAAFAEACTDAKLVIVDADAAARIPADTLEAARRGTRPFVLVVPSPSSPPDATPNVVAYARRVLGVSP